MKSQAVLLGRWPISGKEARQKKIMKVIRKGESLNLIHGKDNHILVSFFVSNEFIHSGTMAIPANRLSDFEKHKGDEVLFVIDGTISVIVQEQKNVNDKSISVARFEVRQGERFLIPEGMMHQYFNHGEVAAKLLFSIAPGL